MQPTCEYLVSHGKSGAFGRFAAAPSVAFRRGDRVVVRSERGTQMGTVLCPATERQQRLLAHTPLGEVVRPATVADEQRAGQLQDIAGELVAQASALAAELRLPLAVLDAEIVLDGKQAFLQCLAADQIEVRNLIERLNRQFRLVVLLENLATPPAEEEHGGCDKPDCGRESGGCSSCGSGGGCSSCGSSKVDMRQYFAHLRSKMEDQHQRTPLL